LTAAPLASMGVLAAGSVLFGSMAFAGFAPVAMFLVPWGASVKWVWLSLAGWSAAFFTGFMLVTLSPARAMAAIVLVVGAPAWAQPAEWRDGSPHKITHVEVEDGVRLEVLDWGGSGRALVLLAGLGDAPHVFDDVAPALVARYRVVGVSRRGHPGSSSPASGYTTARLAEDVVRVIDGLGLQKAVVVGHSFAGEEMHVLGARHANRIAGLIYVDAAFDRADRFAEHEAASRALSGPPRPTPADLASFATLRAYLVRTSGSPGPEARLRARYVANPDGTPRSPWSPDAHVMQAYSAEMKAMTAAYKPDRIQVPALAIYASPKSSAELMRPWYNADDPAVRERVETLYRTERENVARHARWFTAFCRARARGGAVGRPRPGRLQSARSTAAARGIHRIPINSLGFPCDFLANGPYTGFVFPAMKKLLMLALLGIGAVVAYNYSEGRDLFQLPGGAAAAALKDSVRETVRETVRDGVRSAARETSAEVKERAKEQVQTAKVSMTSAALTSKIKAKMALDDGVTAGDINVDTEDGVVTLTGDVESKDEQRRAVRIATETAGVTRVVNRLNVR
jgi:non-heme chloroperoxidase